jgi:hypothetical protein
MSQSTIAISFLSAACLMSLPGEAHAVDSFHFNQSNLSEAEMDAYMGTKRDRKKTRISPMADTGSSLVRHGQRYDIDPRLMIAIAGQESSFGLYLCGDHNAWNWFWGGTCRRSPFASYDRAIQVVSKFMRKSYLNKGYTTIPLIQKKYCVDGCEHWISGVRHFYRELERIQASEPVPMPVPEPALEPVPEPVRDPVRQTVRAPEPTQEPESGPQPVPKSTPQPSPVFKTKPVPTARPVAAPKPVLDAEPVPMQTPDPAPAAPSRSALWLQGAAMGVLLIGLLGGVGFMAYRVGRRHSPST